ncbi:hypothetical protein [Methylobacterium ajmalii]|uniref:hypothetical protein n=1 Tax=Methylobacterium ajmalii TaxID=2738439 RepID=UPI002F2F1E8B
MAEHSTSRRAILAGLAAVSTVPASIGLANPGAGISPDAALLAIAPRLLPVLDRADALIPEQERLYQLADDARQEAYKRADWQAGSDAFDAVREANGYNAIWERHNDIIDEAVEIFEPFLKYRPATLEGVLLKARYAASLEQEWIVKEDLASLLNQRWGVEVSW